MACLCLESISFVWVTVGKPRCLRQDTRIEEENRIKERNSMTEEDHRLFHDDRDCEPFLCDVKM